MLAIKGKQQRAVCAICKHGFGRDEEGSRWEPVATQCNLDELTHVFHRECIEKWRSVPHEESRVCPVCRVNPEQLIRVAQLRRAVDKEVTADRNSWFRLARWKKDAQELFLPLRNSSWRVKYSLYILLVLAIVYAFFILFKGGVALQEEDFVVKRVVPTPEPLVAFPGVKKTTTTGDEL
jgi:hypothetical protein